MLDVCEAILRSKQTFIYMLWIVVRVKIFS